MSQLSTPNRRIQGANGTSYAYRRYGKSGSTPVVFLQHFRGNLDGWDPALVDDIAAEREVILFDASGVGLSTGSVPANFEQFGRDALAFIDALGLIEADLFGFSIGGFVAQEVALQRPYLVRRLILAGTGPEGGREMHGWTEGSVQVITARHAVTVATGSDPLIPDIDGLREAKPWTSRDATSVKHVPASLAIIGGGVVAAEMATAYSGFGTKVTLISRGGLLAGMEPFAGEMVLKAMRESGVIVLLNTQTTRVTRSANCVQIETSDGTVTADEVLVATGRTPRTKDVGLDAIGLTPGGWIDVDDTLLAKGFDWLYAVGDVNHRALLTHHGKYQARAAGDVIAARANGTAVSDAPWGTHVATADHQVVPQVTFTEPEVASVGLTVAAAEKAGYDIRYVDYEMGYLAGASVWADDYTGIARMVVDEKRKVLLGVTFVGPDVSELLSAATVAIVGEVPLDRLWHAVPAYPTVNEIWLRLLETYGRPTG